MNIEKEQEMEEKRKRLLPESQKKYV